MPRRSPRLLRTCSSTIVKFLPPSNRDGIGIRIRISVFTNHLFNLNLKKEELGEMWCFLETLAITVAILVPRLRVDFYRLLPLSRFLSQNSLPPLPPSPTPSTPPPMSAKASSSMTSYSPEDMLTEEEDEVAECILDFPREKLNIVENLGCGYFGDVHICEVDRFPGYDEVFRNTTSDLVIVKSLRPGSSDALR